MVETSVAHPLQETETTKKIAVMVAVIAVASVFAQGPKPAKHTYTAEQARAIALKEYKGKVVGKVVLENENGKWQYAVMIQDGKKIREVMVGADSGKIEHVEITTLQKERAEQAAERKRELKGERERESERARGFRTRARQVGRTKIPHTWGPLDTTTRGAPSSWVGQFDRPA